MLLSRMARHVVATAPTLGLLGLTLAAGLGARALVPPAPLSVAPGVADELLVAGIFATIPADVAWLGLERVTLAPGAERLIGKPDNEGIGPWLYRVEAGDLTVTADGPMAVTRRATPAVLVAPATTIVLHPGERAAMTSGVGARWRNPTSQPVTVLAVSITSDGAGATPPGVTATLLAQECAAHPITLPTEPTAIGLRRLTLQPGATVPAARIAGLTVLAVDTGALTVDDPGIAPGSTPGSFVIRAGDGRLFGGTGYRDVPAGWVFRNASPDPVQLVVLTMTPADPLLNRSA